MSLKIPHVKRGVGKILVMMKLFTFIMLASVLTVTAKSYSQHTKFNMNFESISVQKVFQEIEDNSEFILIFSEESVDLNRTVHVRVKNETVESVLDQVFEGTGNYYEIFDRQIAILSKEKDNNRYLLRNNSEQQEPFVVSGIITDANGATLPGATVLIKGTVNGVVTDINGTYRIKVPSSTNILVFTFVGMAKQEVKVGPKRIINIKMKAEDQRIADVMVVGAYGTVQKRSDMVGSSFQVNAKQLENLPPARVDVMLDGLVPGLTIEPNTDSPGSTRSRYNIRVRGDASLAASNEPLWIVDGTPIFTGDRTNSIAGMSSSISPLSNINPEDIESITVLKDASATSIYGANGANGVILVTTKKGTKKGKSFRFSIRHGISKINENTKIKVLNAEQYMELAKESYMNAGLDMAYFPFLDNDMNNYSTTSTDWYDVYYKIGNNLQGNISASGATDKSSYYISGSYYREEQTVKGNTQERYSVRVNKDMFLNDKLEVSFNLASSYNINNIFSPGRDYYEFLPIYSPYYNDGTYRLYNKIIDGKDSDGNPYYKTVKFFNSVAEREENDNRQRTFASNANILFSYDIMKGLSLTSQLEIDYMSSYEDIYEARTNWGGISLDGTPVGYSTRGHVNFLTWTNIERLNYEKEIGVHKIGALLGFEMNSKQYNTTRASGSGFVNDHIKEVAYAVSEYGSSSAKLDRSMSFFVQGTYSYDKRHYFTFNIRKDGNSKFGKDVRWVNFGSLAYSWNIHNEEFFTSDAINILKFKASFGSNGNSRLGSQEALGSYSYNNDYNYMRYSGVQLSAGPNPGLSWETTYMTNVGLRVKLYEKLDVDIEWYNNKTVDLLSKLDVSRTTGDTRVYRNVGSILNRGLEATITSENIKTKNFSWETSLNVSHNKNKLLELYNGIEKRLGNIIWREGHDVNTYFLVRWAGVDPRDGSPMWYDINGNITHTYSYDDRVPYKSSTPDLAGGMINTLEYKDFSLRILLNYTIGGYAFSSFGRGSSSDGLYIMNENQSVNQLDRWQKPGDLALSPKPIWGVSTKSVMNSTRFLHKKTNVRLQNISLSYNLPKNLVNSAGFKNCRLSFVADNVGLWTPYDKKDRNSYRQTMRGYPLESIYSLSLDLTF
uniref:SusC/RagA family TonB-linked outer membrane protein n=1 Tax=uncultured Draconibacterium sp. TaxID=1573823 RepID=UPI003216761A